MCHDVLIEEMSGYQQQECVETFLNDKNIDLDFFKCANISSLLNSKAYISSQYNHKEILVEFTHVKLLQENVALRQSSKI